MDRGLRRSRPLFMYLTTVLCSLWILLRSEGHDWRLSSRASPKRTSLCKQDDIRVQLARRIFRSNGMFQRRNRTWLEDIINALSLEMNVDSTIDHRRMSLSRTCWCCRLLRWEAKCLWFEKSILHTVHEGYRFDVVLLWFALSRSGNGRKGFTPTDDSLIESPRFKWLF